jgi:L-rhamnose-H+ transport protein
VSLVIGLFLTFVGGNSTGYSMLPLKWERVWKWENFWLFYTVVSLLILPPALAFVVCPGIGSVYASLSLNELTKPFIFGALWGFAQLGAGLCVHRLGFALQGALIGGIGTAVGTLVPLIMLHHELVFHTSGLLVFGGTAITLAGVTLCGWAGYHRERMTREQGRRAGFSPDETAMSQVEPTREGYILMVVVAIVSGVLSAFTNIALAFGGGIMSKALQAGAAPHWAPFAVWPIVLLGGSAVNLTYAIILLSRNRAWKSFTGGPREMLNPVLGGCMWMGGIALYSSATTYLGVLGVSIGFALFTIILILCGQLAGLFTGEWRQIPTRIYGWFAVGIALLLIAIVTFGAANQYSS